MKKSRREVTIGICVILALVVLFFGIDYLKGVNLLKPTNFYTAQYTNVAGLQVSAPVTLNGYKVGTVREIAYEYQNPGHVSVEIGLDRALRLPRGTQAVIEQGLLGTAEVVLRLGQGSQLLEAGTEIEGVTAPSMLEGITGGLLPQVEAVIPKVDSLLTALTAIASNPAIQASVTRLDDITLNIDRTMRTIAATTAKLPPVVGHVDGITATLDTMATDMAAVAATLRQVPIDSTMQNLLALSANLRSLSQELNNPNSTLGALTHDRALYDNLNQCAQSLDSLLIDVKAHPKRYISIKLL